MKKLVAVIAFAAVAFAAQSATACDWNREASTEQSIVAATAPPAPTTQTTSATPQAPTVAAEGSKPLEPTVPVVLVTDRH